MPGAVEGKATLHVGVLRRVTSPLASSGYIGLNNPKAIHMPDNRIHPCMALERCTGSM